MTPLPTMFIVPPPKKKKILDPQKFHFLLRSPQLFWSEIFRCPPKIFGGGLYHGLPDHSIEMLADILPPLLEN